jgi:hypothetical protein
MKYFIGFFACILILAGTPLVARHLEAPPDGKQHPLNIRVNHDIETDNWPVPWIFQDVLRGTGVSGGFAEFTGCSGLLKGRLKVKQGATLREAMDALVAANPSYQWRLEGGVVDLMPRSGVPLLDTKIGSFQMDATDRETAIFIQNLLRLPEVRERAAQLGLKPGIGQGPGPGVVDEHPVPREPVSIHISVRDVSLRDAFNKVVQTAGDTIWIYNESNCTGSETYLVGVTSGY